MADHVQQFASDNYAGICPEAWQAMQEANHGHEPAYGGDIWTARAADAFRALFETECEVFFAFNGTAANSLALASLCQSYHSVICSDAAHVETDECGAPEFFSNGSKLLAVPSSDGKLTPEDIRSLATRRNDIHFPKPRVVTITQPTETGQVYTVEEVKAISEVCRELNLRLHMDGARFANACASLGCSPADITWKAGVDVLCFGGTKNGMAVGEAIIFFDPKLAEDFDYRCKQAGQLASKMRYLSAPWVRLLSDGTWLRNGAHANACARRLAEQITGVPGLELYFKVEANAVFIKLSAAAEKALRERGWRFYTFIGGSARFMFSWDSSLERVDELAADLRAVAAESAALTAVAR
ncbi:threonine aldolase family protein [Silvibacterium dinghuense]|uniref:L-threonine aldolase n=1 Tax=Silvibacterium dinghuense TaxID=1560006 RepID=A0A4Q1S9Z7_9BACT|nr:low specificity L-threonine aldolase [Silvibacterium dinghuense]RXS93880.1 low specificity L-threonine aldolase [Silvibacterium dinghuense]GGH08448.1 low specificity L-threonine aldolase [Silvibacterium dinghuense]